MAAVGLERAGHHGRMSAMGVPRQQLPQWEDLQLLTAQLHRLPLLDDEAVRTETVIGPGAKRPLVLDRPLFVSDMSFGALSYEAKVALARGAEAAGTAICSGEGGMLRQSRRRVRATCTSWRPHASASTSISWTASRPSTSRAARAPRPGPVATSPARR